MGWYQRLRLRTRSIISRRTVERELDEEFRYHLDRLIEERVARGMSPSAARADAMRAMGGAVQAQKEACRDARRMSGIEDWLRDVTLALRSLRRAPGFAVASIGSLAAGLTLVAVTLALLQAYLVRTLPYPASERLYHVRYVDAGRPEPRDLASLDWSALTDVVDVVDRSAGTRFYLADNAATQEVQGLFASDGALDALGIRIVLGRTLTAADFRPDAEPVVLIGRALWSERFASDPQVIGSVVRASSGNQSRAAKTYRIVGVMAPGFRYVRTYARTEVEMVAPVETPGVAYMVRLRPQVAASIVEARLGELVARLPDVTSLRTPIRVRLESVHEQYVSDIRPVLTGIAVAAALVLAVVVANVAILTILRGLQRQKEVAVRQALGASSRQMLRFITAEACVTVAAALIVAVATGALALRGLGPTIAAQLGRPVPGGADALGLNAGVLVTLVLIGGAVTLALSVAPLVTPWQGTLAHHLRRDQRTGTDSRATRWVRSSLMAVEIGSTLTLLVGGGLMVRSVRNIVRTDLGIQTAGVLRTRLALPAAGYPDPTSLMHFYERFLDELGRQSHGLVAVSNVPVLAEPPHQNLEVEGGAMMSAGVRAVSPQYFAVLGVRVRQGRAFEASDRLDSEPVAIVGATLARQLWPSGNAIGQHLRTGERPVANAPAGVWRRVVGIVPDARQSFLDRDIDDVYLPFLQVPNQFAPTLIRTTAPLSRVAAEVRQVVGAVDRSVLVGPVVSLEGEAAEQTAGPRFITTLLTGFSMLAGAIALLGIYGVTAYAVQQRAREIGVRLALGATPRSVVRQFLRRTAQLLFCGVVLGIGGVVVLTRTLEHHLFGVSSTDPQTLGAAILLLGGGGLVATWWPARRITRGSPSTVLRGE